MEDLSSLEELRDRIVSKDWNRIAAGVQAFGFAKLKALRGYRDDPLKLRIAGSRDTVKSVFKKLASLFQEDEEKCRQDIRRLVPVVSELFGAVKRFSQRLDEKKQQKRLADLGIWSTGRCGFWSGRRKKDGGGPRMPGFWRKASTR